jgi:protoporphyrinogen oxidase
MGAQVTNITNNNPGWTVTLKDGSTFSGFDHIISSAPMRELISAISPAVPAATLTAAGNLGYRDFITVILILKDKNIFTDNWIYIHDPSVKVGRIQNFKSWSPEMVPDPTMACYGLEYFCFDTDGLWNTPDDELIALGKKEIEQIGLAQGLDILDGYVVRQKKAYPVYNQTYKQNVEAIKQGLSGYTGLHLIGRNGMHKYNNQDHSMMTAMLAAKNILADKELFDLWKVNEDAEYHETIEEDAPKAGRQMPEALNKA